MKWIQRITIDVYLFICRNEASVEINCCLKYDCLEHLKCLIHFLAFSLQKKQSNVSGQIYQFIVNILALLESIVSSD